MNDFQDKPIRIYIVEDVKMLQLDMIYTLNDVLGIEVVGSAATAEDALQDIPVKEPDVVLMDIGLPGMDGIEATRQLSKMMPNTKIVMLTSHDEKEEVLEALSGGAKAYCMKGIYTDSLVEVIRSVNDGGLWLDPQLAPKLPELDLLRFHTESSRSQNFFGLDTRSENLFCSDQEPVLLTSQMIASEMQSGTETPALSD